MPDIRVSDIMTREVNTCAPATPLTDVVRQLHKCQISCLVATDGNKPVGIITERDLVTILADMLDNTRWDSLAVENFMTQAVVTVPQDATLDEAVRLFRDEGIRHAPVVESNGTLVGVLTQTDVIDGYLRRSPSPA